MKFRAFSLIEMSIVLIIMGLLVGGVMKGKDLLEDARLNALSSQILTLKMAVSEALTKGSLPQSSSEVFDEMHKRGNWDSKHPPATKLGGTLEIEEKEGQKEIVLKDSVLTPRQGQKLLNKMGISTDSSEVRFEGQGCLQSNGLLNQEVQKAVCKVYVSIF